MPVSLHELLRLVVGGAVVPVAQGARELGDAALAIGAATSIATEQSNPLPQEMARRSGGTAATQRYGLISDVRADVWYKTMLNTYALCITIHRM
jgi:hypothetical protein